MQHFFNFIFVSNDHTMLDTRPTTLLNAWEFFQQICTGSLRPSFLVSGSAHCWGLWDRMSQIPSSPSLTLLISSNSTLTLFPFSSNSYVAKPNKAIPLSFVFTNFQLTMPDAVVDLVPPAKLNLPHSFHSTVTSLLRKLTPVTRPDVLGLNVLLFSQISLCCGDSNISCLNCSTLFCIFLKEYIALGKSPPHATLFT